MQKNVVKRVIARAINDTLGRYGIVDWGNVKTANAVADLVADKDPETLENGITDITPDYIQKIATVLMATHEKVKKNIKTASKEPSLFTKVASWPDFIELSCIQVSDAYVKTVRENALTEKTASAINVASFVEFVTPEINKGGEVDEKFLDKIAEVVEKEMSEAAVGESVKEPADSEEEDKPDKEQVTSGVGGNKKIKEPASESEAEGAKPEQIPTQPNKTASKYTTIEEILKSLVKQAQEDEEEEEEAPITAEEVLSATQEGAEEEEGEEEEGEGGNEEEVEGEEEEKIASILEETIRKMNKAMKRR